MSDNFLLLALTFLACLAIRSVYERLKDARLINPEHKFILSLVFAAMGGMWVSWFGMCLLDPLALKIGSVFKWTGFALVILGILLAVAALVQLRGVENIDHLVTSGLFKRLRHPMYTGFILWILGWASYHGAILSFGIGAVGIANIIYWRHLEDGRLKEKYGEPYLRYREKTWF